MSANYRSTLSPLWCDNSTENCQTLTMNRTSFLTSLRPRTVLLAALATVAAGSLGACSDSNNAVDADVTLPAGITLPAGVTLPGVTDDCQAVYQEFITAMTSAFLSTAQAIDYNQVFGDVAAKLPDDLQDEIVALSAAFQQYAEILAEHDNNATSPEVQAAIEGLSTPEVLAAGSTVQAYFDTTCPAAG